MSKHSDLHNISTVKVILCNQEGEPVAEGFAGVSNFRYRGIWTMEELEKDIKELAIGATEEVFRTWPEW